jgi:alkanesulfonate monooxygenase SsuD/methylene tetrahydromethanopterin reductase-like flavin-dependent oxidoreductase (luciferase family)
MANGQWVEEPLSFGVFDQIEYDGRPIGDIYEEHFKLMEYADQAGFYCYHVSEHHGTPLSLSISPNMILAAAAQRTKRIRLAALVYCLPYYEPYRLANEITMLDHMTGGRIEVGVGRGVSPIEAAFFGIPNVEESRAIYRETLDIMLETFKSDELNFKGKYHSYANFPLRVPSVQKPYPPLWFPSSNSQSVPFTAGNGFNTIFNNRFSLEETKSLVRQYKTLWIEHRDDADRMNGHEASPKLGLSIKVYVAPTDKEAEEEAFPAFRAWGQHISFLSRRAGGQGDTDRENFDAQRANGTLIIGSPDSVIQQIQSTVDFTGINYLLSSFAFGDLQPTQYMRTIELFAKEVIPAVASSITTAG